MYTTAALAADIDSHKGFPLNSASTTSIQIAVNLFNFREFWRCYLGQICAKIQTSFAIFLENIKRLYIDLLDSSQVLRLYIYIWASISPSAYHDHKFLKTLQNKFGFHTEQECGPDSSVGIATY